MSTSEAQITARALFDALVRSSSGALQATAAWVSANPGGQPQRINELLPADAPQQVRNLIQVLARENKLYLLPVVAQEFQRFAAGASEQALSGEITSAVELDATQQAKILADLRGKYGERLELQFKVDPSIIGGLIIRIGDQVLDNSLRTRLSAVERSMLSS